MRSIVFTSLDVGYWFFLDGDDDFFYMKTTDGGGTWGSPVEIDTDTTIVGVAFDIWYDRWGPGDTGTKIHIAWFTSDNDLVVYRSLDTLTDTLSSQTTVYTGASSVAGRGSFVSIAKARSGYIYVAYDIDAGAEKGLHRSTDGGANWSASLASTFVEATTDEAMLFPASNTGDDNDIWAVYLDTSANALTLKMWDSSAGAEVESSTIQTHTPNSTDLTGQFGYSGAIRHSDGHLILAAVSERDTATADHQVYDINGTGSIVSLTAITTNIDDHYHPAVFIDQFTGYIYVAYNGKRDGSETMGTTTKVYYTKSTDGGSTWSAGDTAYMEGSAGVVVQVWSSVTGFRFYVGWRVGTTILGNKVNSVDLTPPLSNLSYDRLRNPEGPIPFPTIERKRPVEPIAAETTQGLTGVLATAAVGLLAVASSLGITGVGATGNIGIGPVTFDKALTSVVGTTAQNSLAFGPTLSGLGATSGIGSVAVTFAITPTGIPATGSLGTLAESDTRALSGVTGTTTLGTLSPAFDIPLSGLAGTSALGSLGAGTDGSIALTSVVGTSGVGSLGVTDSSTLSGIVGTSTLGTETPSFGFVPSGFEATSGQGSLNTGSSVIDRPRIVRGPFPFPKSVPSFVVTAAGIVTNVALTGIGATGQVGDIETPIFMDVPLVGAPATGLTGTIQGGTPGNAVLVGVQGDSGTGVLVATIPRALIGVTATSVLGNVAPGRLEYNRPSSVAGPFPFLPSSSLFSRQGKPRPVLATSGSPVTINLTGVSATTSVGTITFGNVNVSLVGAPGTSALGTLIATDTVAALGIGAVGSLGTLGTGNALSGLSATSATGLLSITDNVTLVGSAASGQPGTLSTQVNTDATIGLTGIAATSAVGTLTPQLAPSLVGSVLTITQGAFGFAQQLTGVTGISALGIASVNVTIALTGQTASGQLGNPTAQGDSNFTVTLSGVVGSTALGAMSLTDVVPITGVSATTALGTVSFGQILSGRQASGLIGTQTPSITIGLIGASASGVLGNPTAQGDSNFTVTLNGITAISSLGALSAVLDRSLTGSTGTTAVGTCAFVASGILSGALATTQLGQLAIATDGTVQLSGVQATAVKGAPVFDGGVTLIPVVAQALIAGLGLEIPLVGVSANGIAGPLPSGGASVLDITGQYLTLTDIVGEFE